MSDNANSNAASHTPASTDQGGAEPSFSIQRVYMKDFSLEQPNSPAILLEQGQPSLDIQLDVQANQVNPGFFEVVVKATVHSKLQDKTLFLVEAQQAGIFEIQNVEAQQMGPVLGITCPHILYPYLRAFVADAIGRAGFAPVHLEEINFQAMYESALASQDNASEADSAADTTH